MKFPKEIKPKFTFISRRVLNKGNSKIGKIK